MIVYITTLEEAERIVKRNYNLYWQGWEIVFMKPDRESFRKATGCYHNGKWHNKTILPLTRQGWAIPKELIR